MEQVATYNTQQEPIILKEYGRNIQNLVSKIKAEEDQDRKLLLSHALVQLMNQLNPNSQTGSPEDLAKTWDYLHIIADFDLGLENPPHEVPTREKVYGKPDRIPYPESSLRFRHYGQQVQAFIQEAIKIEDPKKREAAVITIGKIMKQNYIQWNNDKVSDEVIIKNIKMLSNDELDISPELVAEHNLFKLSIKPGNNPKNSSNSSNNNRKPRRSNNRQGRSQRR